MAVVKGVKEKVHLPLYDSIVVKPKEQLGKSQPINTLRFFQDVSGKTKLQTNMQASSLLPHWNTFEARALRVVISDLAPQFPENPAVSLEFEVSSSYESTPASTPPIQTQTRKVNLTNISLRHLVDFRRQAKGSNAPIKLEKQDDIGALGLKLAEGNNNQETTLKEKGQRDGSAKLITIGEAIVIDQAALKDAENKFDSRLLPPGEQVFSNDGLGNTIGKFIYNSVTSFFVGEKTMIQAPTWFFPAGAGPYAENGKVVTHGYPSPEATFRFAEPVQIDAQQNFRVEIEIPEGEVLSDLQKLYGPFFIWVVLDGYMTRDVQ